MKAVGHYIIINPKKEIQSTTKGGLILGEKDKEDFRYKQATVSNVGPDVFAITKGDEIYYDKVAGDLLEINDKEYTIIKDSDVVIVL